MSMPDPLPVITHLQHILETGSRCVRGGLDPQSGAGCYGLVWYAFNFVGIVLPTTAEEGQHNFTQIAPPYQPWDVVLGYLDFMHYERHLGLLLAPQEGYHISQITNGLARFTLQQPLWRRILKHGLRYRGFQCD